MGLPALPPCPRPWPQASLHSPRWGGCVAVVCYSSPYPGWPTPSKAWPVVPEGTACPPGRVGAQRGPLSARAGDGASGCRGAWASVRKGLVVVGHACQLGKVRRPGEGATAWEGVTAPGRCGRPLALLLALRIDCRVRRAHRCSHSATLAGLTRGALKAQCTGACGGQRRRREGETRGAGG